jgi:hypothetical protein
MRVPGFTGSLGAGVEPQDSLAIRFSLKQVFLTLLQLRGNS